MAGLLGLIGSLFGGAGRTIGTLLGGLFGGGQRRSPSSMPLINVPTPVAPAPPVPTVPAGYNIDSIIEAARTLAELDMRRHGLGGGAGGGTKGGSSMPGLLTPNQAGGATAPSLNLDDLARRYAAQILQPGQASQDSTWAQAAASLGQTLRAQGQQARLNLMNQLGSMGMLRSGLASRGSQQIAQSTAQALSTGLANLQSSRLQQAQQERQWAAELALQTTFQTQKLELEARQVGLSEEQIRDAKQQAWWNTFGQLAASFGSQPNNNDLLDRLFSGNASGTNPWATVGPLSGY